MNVAWSMINYVHNHYLTRYMICDYQMINIELLRELRYTMEDIVIIPGFDKAEVKGINSDFITTVDTF